MVKGTNTQSILGVVLAGGKSSRMGTDKALLPFMGRTLLDFQFEKLADVLGPENIVVSGNYPHFPHLLDEMPGLGPLGGIISSINKFKEYSHFLFLPVDMPNISKQTLISLIDFAKKDQIFDCWTFKNFQMPLIIKNHIGLKEPTNDRSITFLIKQLNSTCLDPKNLNMNEFLNTNTIKEWQEVNL